MSVMGIGASSTAWDYWEYLRRIEAQQSAAAPGMMDVVKPVGEEQKKSASLPAEEFAPVIPPERRNLFAQQLAASILEQEEGEEGSAATAAKAPAAASGGGESASSGSSGGKVAVKSVTDGKERFTVGFRVDGEGNEVEVFRIPEGASARNLPVEETEEFPEMELLDGPKSKGKESGESGERTQDAGAETPRSKFSAALIQQARIAYGMIASPFSI